MSRIKNAFNKGKAFIAFVTCGDPDLATTAAVVREAVKNGADLVELGIPCANAMADGPVIQAANKRALAGGTTVEKIFELVGALRKETAVPLVFMTYKDVVFDYGIENFLASCEELGIDGLILPDLSLEQRKKLVKLCHKYHVDLISLIAPVIDDGVKTVAQEAEGFIYVMSKRGLTGTPTEISANLISVVQLIKQSSNIPCCIGFGISTPEQAKAMAGLADGVIVGSAIIKLLAKYSKDAPRYVGAYVKSMKGAVKEAN